MSPKHVVLINPPQAQLKEPTSYVPLGLGYLAAALEKDNVKVTVCNLAGKDYRDVSMEDIPRGANFYGISCVTPTYNATKHISLLLKSHGYRVGIGGIHACVLPEKTLKETGCDHVFVGEAETTIIHVLHNAYAPPIIKCGVVEDLNKLLFPARHLFEQSTLINKTNIHIDTYAPGGATTILTSRGCPYNCAFCCKTDQTRKVRLRSPENVIGEIRHLIEKYSVRQFRFIDDMFTVNRKRVVDFCNQIINSELDIYWMCITRLDSVDKDLLDLMYTAGCREISAGVESGSNRMLKLMNKRTTVEKNKHAIGLIKDSGIGVKEFLMFGFPGENRESVESTMKFVTDTQPDKLTLSTFIPLPGSDVWNNPAKYGIKLKTNMDEYWFYWDKGQEEHGFPYEIENKGELVVLRQEMIKFINNYRRQHE